MSEDKYTDNTIVSPATDVFAVTPSDGTALTKVVKALYVGGTGNVAIKTAGSSTAVTFVGVPAGAILPVRAAYVMSTNTTATSIVGLY